MMALARRSAELLDFCCVTHSDHHFPNLSTSPHIFDGFFGLLKSKDFVYHIVKAQLSCLYGSYEILEVVFRSNVDASVKISAWPSLVIGEVHTSN